MPYNFHFVNDPGASKDDSKELKDSYMADSAGIDNLGFSKALELATSSDKDLEK